jgi:hypothetical protein
MVIPVNMTIARAPMISSVMAALRDLGFWNAGTPLLITSTPVSAEQPAANARNASSTVRYPLIGWLAARCAPAPEANGTPAPNIVW